MTLSKVTPGQQSPNTVEKKEVKINQEPNRQENASPSKTTFDLNDYWNQGYREDTEEQNEEVAKKIRHDILSRYDIEDDDSNKEEKLVRIYLDILDDEKNKDLKNNLGEDAYYKGDDEDFIDDVEKMMAHMTHDGSKDGDKVCLSEVDFSDIEYNDESKSGMMETKTVNNGFEYTIYDENGHVEKFISKTVDSNELTTISTYSDADRTDLISEEEVFEFSKSDDELKYKFAGGNQNTVDFKDNGDSIAVEITKGDMRENLTLEKNADGTYSFDGKQFFTIEEAAIAMNNREIKGNEELDGILGPTQQGKTGNCGFLTSFTSLNSTDYGREINENSISFDSEGNIIVDFAGIGRQYKITRKELENAKIFSTGDPDLRAFELAWEKMLIEIKDGILVNGNSHAFNETARRIEEKILKGYNATAATYSASVYEVLTGKKAYSGFLADSGMLEMLDDLENNGNIAITVGNVPDEIREGKKAVTSESATTFKTYKDAFGNDIKIYDMHSYAVKESDTKPDGTRIITIINPHDTSQEIVLDEETYLKAFNQTDNVIFSKELLEPAYVLA